MHDTSFNLIHFMNGLDEKKTSIQWSALPSMFP